LDNVAVLGTGKQDIKLRHILRIERRRGRLNKDMEELDLLSQQLKKMEKPTSPRETESSSLSPGFDSPRLISHQMDGISPNASKSSGSTPKSAATSSGFTPKSASSTAKKSDLSSSSSGEVVKSLPRKTRKSEKDHVDDEISDKARHEADIVKRITDMQGDGLWTGKKLVKKDQNVKQKAHWDFVLEEMTWLAQVVQLEIKTKKANAKKCAQMVQKHFRDKELAVTRAEKARDANLKKVALFMSREIKNFWGNVEKLFEFRVNCQLEMKRKEALDQHLNFIVDKTEKYSTLLAESLAVSEVGSGSGQVSRAESRANSVSSEGVENDGEYAPDGGSSDDEETIDKEEKEDVEDNKDEGNEINMLNNEADIPIEELLKKFYPEQFKDLEVAKKEAETKGENMDVDNGDDMGRGRRKRKVKPISEVMAEMEQEKDKDSTNQSNNDDEKTETGEQTLQKMETETDSVNKTTEEEKADKDKTTEENKAVEEDENKTTQEVKVGEEEIKADEEEENKTIQEDKANEEEEADEEEPGLEELMAPEDQKLEDYANMAAEFQPTGNTLATTNVKTKLPFLLKHTLREYQHIGLDWLVSLKERELNGILADEMGLGKTIQTIALLAHLAGELENWGPHLIVVPTSVMLNWEMEIKKWCPAFKVLVYYGSQKERKLKRVGWTKPNAFHICITSYKLVIQDHSSFRRKKWTYFILDEAQHIKNFKSQRWQLLLNFDSECRLLLTGTPLQNNLMELWSLMHFLMPHVFESHRDFKEWFSNPMTGMVEGSNEYNDGLIKRLHKVLRPFLLRRLKCEVEKQLPQKYHHLVKCPLSKRQRFLYDDFMSRSKTRDTLSSGNLLSVINVLMQLRKCCNHPNLFEPRPTISPFVIDPLEPSVPSMVQNCLDYNPFKQIHLPSHLLLMAHHEKSLTGFTAFRSSQLCCSPRVMLHPPATPPRFLCPINKVRVKTKLAVPALPPALRQVQVPQVTDILSLQNMNVGPVIPIRHLSHPNQWLWHKDLKLKTPTGYYQLANISMVPSAVSQIDPVKDLWTPPRNYVKQTDSKKSEATKRKAERSELSPVSEARKTATKEMLRNAKGIFSTKLFARDDRISPPTSPNILSPAKRRKMEAKARELEMLIPRIEARKESRIIGRRKQSALVNTRRCNLSPLFGFDLVSCVQEMSLVPCTLSRSRLEQMTCSIRPPKSAYEEVDCYALSSLGRLVANVEDLLTRLDPIFSRYMMFMPPVRTNAKISKVEEIDDDELCLPGDYLERYFQVQMPDTRLIQYDCGKLQILSSLLRKLHVGGHRALIFTQMTKMLDVLEAFLNYHGFTYLRLDGSTKVEQRQVLMERFNSTSKYFIFILSTRSGGVGINLTGADTVIFYDSDWNPTMDAQAQDRCHRIGQTRDVHIYRLVSERTIEENILKKANQKRLLGDMAIEGGNFTTAAFKKSTIHDLFNLEDDSQETEAQEDQEQDGEKKTLGNFESALATAEDDSDIQAARAARAEENPDLQDFVENTEEDQFNAVLSELSPIERYALKHMEFTGRDWVQHQLDAAEAELQANKAQFDAEKLEELTQEIREENQEIGESSGEESGGEEEDEDDSRDTETDSDDSSSGEEEESDNESEENQVDNGDHNDGNVHEVKKLTRSRGNVDINLFDLGETPDLKKTSGSPAQSSRPNKKGNKK